MRYVLATVTVFCVMGALHACSAGGDPFEGGSEGTGASGTASTSTGSDGGGINMGGFNAGGSSSETYGCSADLRYVVDANGTVVDECWPDYGCFEGQCIDPCTAAAGSQGNVGCDFTVATPHFYVGIAPPCFAVFLANNWPKPVAITVERGGQTYDVSAWGKIAGPLPNEGTWAAIPPTGLPEGEVAVLFLSHDPSSSNGGNPLTCPVPPAITQGGGSAVAGSNVGQAWRITTDIPVSAYDILPYGGADSYLPSAELILPTSAWGTNYIAVTPQPSSGPPWGQLTAHQDTTQIQILPTVNLPAAGAVPAAPAGQTTTFNLNAGEYVQWQLTQGQDMSGSVIQADKPVVFTGGDAYICYGSATSSGGGCDSAHQMIPPLSAMASEYAPAPYAPRGSVPESIVYRLVGVVDGTQLTYDPAVPGPPTLDSGQVAQFETVGPFTVTSQDEDHPFYVGQLMAGCHTTGNAGNLGDEEYVNVLPPAQFLRKYVFFTDPTYPTTNLAVVRVNNGDGFHDVTVDCLGALTGWVPVGTSGKYEVTTADLIRGGTGVNGCTNGPHVATSDGQFGMTVWGLDWYSSYAYPAGGSVATINTVVVPPVPN
jgi:hypothetical protein